MTQLSALGFDSFFSQQLDPQEIATAIPARISAEHRGAYEVWCETGTGRAELAGRLRQGRDGDHAPAVGDWVLVKNPPAGDQPAIIDRVLKHRTAFTRGAAGGGGRTQVVAANVDLVFAVCGLDADFNPRRIERYLARIWASGASPAVILNKADLCDAVPARVAEITQSCTGVPILVTSALYADGLDAVRRTIAEGMTVALVGSSGAGKSTLLNRLLGEEHMQTGPVRTSDGRGQHVTTHRELVLLPQGGVLLDTPGMRELALVDEQGLDAVFGDVEVLASRCRFRDCRHETEPGCAVKEAVASGQLAAERLAHLHKLEREAQAFELRHDEHKRRQAERVWGQLVNEVKQLRKWKGGKP